MLLIFDCDGVLRSISWQALHEGYLAIADHLGCDPLNHWTDLGNFPNWFNSDWHYNLERMGMPLGSDYSQVTQIFKEIYDPTAKKFSWVDELIPSLADRHQLAIFSSAKADGIRASLGDSARHFKRILGMDEVSRVKPDPEGIYLLLEDLDTFPDETFMIGDADVDVLAGKKAEIKTVGVTWGLSDLEKMRSLSPDYIFSNPKQFIELF